MPGMVLASWEATGYDSPTSDAVIGALSAGGVRYLEIVVTQYLSDIAATSIAPLSGSTPSDESIRHAVAVAAAQGIRVVLKPHVDIFDGTWRGFIGSQYNSSAVWGAWWGNYTQFIVHYAALAEQLSGQGLWAFNVGTELQGTESQDAEWRRVIAAVRGVYSSGPLWYGANHGDEGGITWWDALDAIGVDAYYPLSATPDPSLAAATAAWQPIVASLADLAARWNRSIVFAEVGYASWSGAAVQPWACCTGPADQATQAILYQALFDAVWQQPWFAGAFWWASSPGPLTPAPNSTDFSMLGKEAWSVLSAAYGAAAGIV